MQSLITTLHKGILKQPDCTCSSGEGWRIISLGTEAWTRPRHLSFLNSPRLQVASSLSTFFLSRFRHLNSLTGDVAGHCSDDSSVRTLRISNTSLEKVPCEVTLCEEPWVAAVQVDVQMSLSLSQVQPGLEQIGSRNDISQSL